METEIITSKDARSGCFREEEMLESDFLEDQKEMEEGRDILTRAMTWRGTEGKQPGGKNPDEGDRWGQRHRKDPSWSGVDTAGNGPHCGNGTWWEVTKEEATGSRVHQWPLGSLPPTPRGCPGHSTKPT